MTKKKRTGETQPSAPRREKNILWFKEISIADVPLVGGKNASLGEMFSKLTDKGIRVPNGFAITAHAYWEFLHHAGLEAEMKKILKDLDVANVRELAKAGKTLREMILKAHFPAALEKEILSAYAKLSDEHAEKNLSVAIRSSATAEDLPDASFAGQQETYLNIQGNSAVLQSVRRCIASLFTNRAISYREGRGFDHMSVALSVTVQQMVKGDTGASGVMFTLDTESGFRGVTLVTGSYRLGEYVVKGGGVPDQFYIFKEGLRKGKPAIMSRFLGTKQVKLVYSERGGTRQASVSQAERNRFCIEDEEVLQLGRWADIIESHYGKPQDIEWVKEGKTGDLYIVQARPETVKARSDEFVIEKYELKQTGAELLHGIAVGQKIGAGKVRVIEHPAQMKLFKKGEVLVTRITDPDWEPIMRIASAIVTEQGGKTSHAAIVSRELGVPCIVGAHGARKMLKTGQEVTASCAKGDEGIVYKGILPFEVKRTEIKEIEQTKTKIMMIVGDPDHAFHLSFLPHDGVGLARLEFIFSNFIRIHPLALVHYDRLKDKHAKKKIREMTRGYKNKTDYCVDKLAEGVARIATAMYPHQVIVRMSDFKTNEYATLIGGREFEPEEENPMIGWRGASRYYSKEYKEGFALECKAIKKVREEWGLENVTVMVPFCRTPEEGERVLETMAEFGLKRGEHGLEVYVMCEIPSNVILAEEFAKIFDGFSIGSNDLTQLTLAVDRDSALVSHIFDENNPAVKKLIKDVIAVAHKHGKKIGICGQAPSDHPEFAEFLVREGIDSISLNPDTVVSTRQRIAYVEKTVGKTGKKTNPKVLSMVIGLGLFAAGFLGIGAGCSTLNSFAAPAPEPEISRVSPAEIRQRVTEKVLAETQQTLNSQVSPLSVSDFANFSLEYPSWWGVHAWAGGITLSHAENGDTLSLFRQLVSHPVSDNSKQDVVLGTQPAKKYIAKTSDGKEVTVFEIAVGEDVMEIDAVGEKAQAILESFQFSGMSDAFASSVSHWDVREKRFCAPMVTYAREPGGISCTAYMNPCDIPDAFEVCDAEDAE